MFESSTLIASLIWGSVGIGFAIYGKRQQASVIWIGGLALIAISYVISSALYMSLAGAGILAAMFWLKNRMD